MALVVAALCRLLPITLFASSSAAASFFEPGDVIVAGVKDTGPVVGAVRVFRADGTLRGELSLGGLGEVRFAPDGTLAVLNGNEIVFVRSDGGVAKRIAIPRGYGADPGYHITFARNGSFLVANPFGILDFSSEGVPGDSTFPADPAMVPPPIITGLDLSSNPCILFASDMHIVALNLCGASVYPPKRILPVSGRGVRLLPDGTFITSFGSGPFLVRRYRPDGSLVRPYTPTGLVLAIDANPRFAWLEIQAGVVQKLDLESDALVGPAIVTGFPDIRGLAPVGEWRAGIDAPQPIPTLSEWVLIGLAVMLGVIALRRLA